MLCDAAVTALLKKSLQALYRRHRYRIHDIFHAASSRQIIAGCCESLKHCEARCLSDTLCDLVTDISGLEVEMTKLTR